MFYGGEFFSESNQLKEVVKGKRALFIFSLSGHRVKHVEDSEKSDSESDFYLDEEEFPQLEKSVRFNINSQ